MHPLLELADGAARLVVAEREVEGTELGARRAHGTQRALVGHGAVLVVDLDQALGFLRAADLRREREERARARAREHRHASESRTLHYALGHRIPSVMVAN